MRAALLFAATTLLPAQNIVYLDPALGVDAPGGGSAAQPLKTLTFASSQTTGPTVFRLRAGTYGAASGESFPIALPPVCVVEADPARVPVGSEQVVIETALGLTSTFFLAPRAPADVTLRELVCSGGMFRAVRLDVLAGNTANLTLEGCSLAQSRCVVVNAAAGARATVVMRDCRCNAVDAPVAATTEPSARIDLGIERCILRAGLRAGIVLDASAGGAVQLLLRHSVVGLCDTRGIHALTDQGGSVVTRIEHCLLHEVGLRVVGGSPGAIVDTVGRSGQAPQHTVVNSLFHRNRSDAPNGTSPSYAWGNNLVSQASLIGLGGNQLATAQFVDEASGDWHLLPGSPGRDAGRAADRTSPVDFEGDPYLGPPDLGPDEAQFAYLVAAPHAALGRTLTLQPLVAPQAPFAALLGTAATPTFGPGTLHLTGVVVDPGLVGFADTRGVGRLDLAVPNSRFLAGQILYWQTLSATPPWLGANARRTVLVLR